jgi:peptide subunit release factor 1 (eRF1)
VRRYGEPSLIKVGSVLTRYSYRAYKKAGRELIAVKCNSCGYETCTEAGKLYKYHKDGTWLCPTCGIQKRKADKKELNQALINLARNKGLIT